MNRRSLLKSLVGLLALPLVGKNAAAGKVRLTSGQQAGKTLVSDEGCRIAALPNRAWYSIQNATGYASRNYTQGGVTYHEIIEIAADGKKKTYTMRLS